MTRMEIGELWAVEVHELGAVRIRQVRDLLEGNAARARRCDRPDRMVVALEPTFEAAQAAALEMKRARRAVGGGAGGGKGHKGREGTK
jgi:hypothetical protein